MEQPSTPCIKVCKVQEGLCTSCNRTLEEIRLWKNYTETKRQEIMSKLRHL